MSHGKYWGQEIYRNHSSLLAPIDEHIWVEPLEKEVWSPRKQDKRKHWPQYVFLYMVVEAMKERRSVFC